MLWPTVRVLLSILSSYALFHDCCNFFGGLYVTYPIILLKLRYLLGGFVMIILFDAKIKTAFVTIIMYNLCISHVFKAGNFCTLPHCKKSDFLFVKTTGEMLRAKSEMYFLV